MGLFGSLLRRAIKQTVRDLASPPRKPKPLKSSTKTAVPPPKPFSAATSQPVSKPRSVSGPAYVIDGDSLIIQKTQIRLFGVDAPELDHPFGQKAKWALVALCKGHKATAAITDIDDHGRTVAKCTLPDGRDLSAEMVKAGMALDWPKFSGGIYKCFETTDARKKLWLADARQKGRMHVWESFKQKRRNQ